MGSTLASAYEDMKRKDGITYKTGPKQILPLNQKVEGFNEATSALCGITGPGGLPVAYYTNQKFILLSDMSHFSSGISTAI